MEHRRKPVTRKPRAVENRHALPKVLDPFPNIAELISWEKSPSGCCARSAASQPPAMRIAASPCWCGARVKR